MAQGKRNEKRNETTPPKEKTNKRGDRRGVSPASQANLKPIQPGEVRNPKGWPKGKRHTDTLYELSMQRFEVAILESINAKRKLKKQAPLTLEDSGVDPELDMWLKQMEKARNGDTKAFEIINAYRHGKPTTRVEVTGLDGQPISHEVRVKEGAERLRRFQKKWFKKPVEQKVKEKLKRG